MKDSFALQVAAYQTNEKCSSQTKTRWVLMLDQIEVEGLLEVGVEVEVSLLLEDNLCQIDSHLRELCLDTTEFNLQTCHKTKKKLTGLTKKHKNSPF